MSRMVEKDKFLVVVSVLEGRKFPKRPKHKLLVEARFDGELLATDPVEHGEGPDFTQELAWELDKKGLHQHRLQRTSVKVQVYAVDNSSTAREPVGYVVLDLRSAHNTPSSKWYSLLHTKYSRNKPELKLGIYIDDDKGQGESSFRATQAPARAGSPSQKLPMTPRSLRPILNDSEGCYQIGPPARCKEQFLLSVTVAFAANLPQLVPTSIPLPSSGFFFYYSLLGNDVTNETFRDLVNPNFAAERASVRIRSSVEALEEFFSSQPGLELHLCCGDQSLGSCDIPLNTLLKKGSTEIYMKPVSIEGAFELVPPARFRQQMAPVAQELKPLVGVSILLRKEDGGSSGESKGSPAAVATSEEKVPSPRPAKSSLRSPKGSGKGKKSSPPAHLPTPSSPHDGSYTETFDSHTASKESGENVKSLGEEVREKAQAEAASSSNPARDQTPDVSPVHDNRMTPPPHSPTVTPPQRPCPQQKGQQKPRYGEGTSSSLSQQHVLIPPQAHHYSFAIELRSIRNLKVTHHANIFLRYTYPFFGSAAPVMTQPSVEVRPKTEVIVPQGYCYFDFASAPQQLHDTFLRMPLVVEVWDRQADRASNHLLGAVHLSLAQVFSAEKSRAVHEGGTPGWRQVWSDHIPVTSTDGEPSNIGEVYVVLTLEDWGPLPTNIVLDKDSTSQGVSSSESTNPPGAKNPSRSPQAAPVEPRETLEYKAALELELWKEQQEQIFEEQLKEKEQKYMRALAEEWRKRHKDSEVLMQKKVAEYQSLEERLRKTVTDLDKREKQLQANEQEVLRLRADLQREHDRKMAEMRDASRRMKEDCDHLIQLQKDRVKEHEETINRLKLQITEAEKRYQQLSREFAAYREQQNSKPEVRLQSEINLLTIEKVELERKLDAQTKSKVHYKQQWAKALKELAHLKERQQKADKAQLRRQQQELEHMRLRYLAAEEKEVVQNERKQLQDIKNELDHLREADTDKTPLDGHTGMLTSDPAAVDVHDEHITRLIEERDSLLRTGVYTSEDRIIIELDRQIREAIASRGSAQLIRKIMKRDMHLRPKSSLRN